MSDCQKESWHRCFLRHKSCGVSLCQFARQGEIDGPEHRDTKKYLPQTYGQHDQAVMLSSVSPKNELDLIPNMLYEHSNLSLKEIKHEVEKWSYDKKEAVFMAYVGERLNRRHKPGRALEHAYYSWDLV